MEHKLKIADKKAVCLGVECGVFPSRSAERGGEDAIEKQFRQDFFSQLTKGSKALIELEPRMNFSSRSELSFHHRQIAPVYISRFIPSLSRFHDGISGSPLDSVNSVNSGDCFDLREARGVLLYLRRKVAAREIV